MHSLKRRGCKSATDSGRGKIHLPGGGENNFYIEVYVDDMILAGKDESKMENVKKELS